jgi:hypothetical protein
MQRGQGAVWLPAPYAPGQTRSVISPPIGVIPAQAGIQ